jgi:hypothetical protein
MMVIIRCITKKMFSICRRSLNPYFRCLLSLIFKGELIIKLFRSLISSFVATGYVSKVDFLRLVLFGTDIITSPFYIRDLVHLNFITWNADLGGALLVILPKFLYILLCHSSTWFLHWRHLWINLHILIWNILFLLSPFLLRFAWSWNLCGEALLTQALQRLLISTLKCCFLQSSLILVVSIWCSSMHP